jgi:hypothetical protein
LGHRGGRLDEVHFRQEGVIVGHVFARLQRRGEPPAHTVVGVMRLFRDGGLDATPPDWRLGPYLQEDLATS